MNRYCASLVDYASKSVKHLNDRHLEESNFSPDAADRSKGLDGVGLFVWSHFWIGEYPELCSWFGQGTRASDAADDSMRGASTFLFVPILTSLCNPRRQRDGQMLLWRSMGRAVPT